MYFLSISTFCYQAKITFKIMNSEKKSEKRFVERNLFTQITLHILSIKIEKQLTRAHLNKRQIGTILERLQILMIYPALGINIRKYNMMLLHS